MGRTKTRIKETDVVNMSVKERMLFYVEYIGESKMDFYELSGLNPSIFTKSTLKNDCVSTTIAAFKKHFTRVSLEWIILGRGEMEDRDDGGELLNLYRQRSAEKDEVIALLEGINEENKARIAELKEMISLLREIKKGRINLP